MKLYRAKIVNEMRDVNKELLEDGEDPKRILFYLVIKYRPSFWELRDAIHPLVLFKEAKPEERGLYAARLTRTEIRLFNKERIFNQLIGTEKQRIDIFKGKKTVKRTVWQLGIAMGELAEEMQTRLKVERVGINDRIGALNDRVHAPQQYRREADNLRRSIEKRRRRGQSIEVSR